jgi:hypothetical protein
MAHRQLGVNGGEHANEYLIAGDVDPIHGYAYAEHGFYTVISISLFVVEPFVEFLGWFLEVDVLPGVEEAFANEYIFGFCGGLRG